MSPRPPRRVALRAVLLAALVACAALGSAPEATLGQPAARTVLNALDFPSIHAAVDALPQEGGTVVIPAGVFDVQEKIRLPSHVELRGAGIDRTILVLADGARDHLISNADLVKGNTNIVVRDLQLRGNKDGQRVLKWDGRLLRGKPDAWSFGIRFANVTDSLIQNVEASDFTKDGIYLGYNRVSGTYRTRVVNCRARDNGRNGISLTHGSFNLIENCDVRDNNRWEKVGGIQLEPDEDLEVSHNVVVGNRAANNHTGISLYTERRTWKGQPVLVENAVCFNTAERNSFVGIWDHFGQGNYFVENTARGSQHDFGPAESSRVGPQYLAACEPPPEVRAVER